MTLSHILTRRFRPVAVAAAITLAFGVTVLTEPASAAPDAVTLPTISAPTRASLAASTPLFWITRGSRGEMIESVQITPLTRWSEERVARIRVSEGVSTVRTPRALHAGRYRVVGRWLNEKGQVAGATEARIFTIAPRVRSVRIRSLRQSTFSPNATFTASFRSNVPVARVTCSITYNGRLVDRAVYAELPTNLVTYNTFAVFDMMEIPEIYDARRLRVTIDVVARGARGAGGTTFIAK